MCFDALPTRSELDEGEIQYYLEETATQARLDRIGKGAPLSKAEAQSVLMHWMEERFSDPDLGGISGYGINELSDHGGGGCVVVTYWDGDYLKEGWLAGAFRSKEGAEQWLHTQAILDSEWLADEDAACRRAFKKAATGLCAKVET
jgi:hypothetical protein